MLHGTNDAPRAPRQIERPASLIGLGIQAQDPEVALACFLESLEPGDPQILTLLTDHYAPAIYRLAQALLDAPRPSAVETIGQQILVQAAAEFDQFSGATSIQVWLFEIALKSLLAHQRRLKWQRILARFKRSTPRQTGQEPRRPQTPVERRYWAAIDSLNRKQRTCVILRYLYGLSVPEIAHILGSSATQTHTCLVAARRTIQRAVSDSQEQPQKGTGHPEIQRQIQAALDGLLESVPAQERLDRHLSTCAVCRAYSHAAKQLESRLGETLQTRWPAPALAPSATRQPPASATSQVRKKQAARQFALKFKEFSLLGVALLAVVAVLYQIERADTHTGRPLFPPTPAPPPTPLESATGIVKDISGQTARQDSGMDIIFNSDPHASADGTFVVFTSSDNSLIPGDTNPGSDVFVLDRRTGTIERVSVGSDGTQANGANFTPGISADGRWVVFGSVADNLVPGDDQTCTWWQDGSESTCVDIFTHDRDTGRTEMVTLAQDGGAANGNSFYPAISANGRWITFWSAASNLVAVDTEMCGEEDDRYNCLDVFVYDRATGRSGRVPIGRSREMSNGGPVTISDDGRYLALVLRADDLAAKQALSTNPVDSFVYDRQTGEFEPLNVSGDGTAGNRPSVGAVISADGRYAAFASWASNLVEGDDNDHADVFVRDLAAGTTEMVSVGSDGAAGNGNSGTFFDSYNVEGWGKQIGISDDGRYVVFISYASNLGAGEAHTSSLGDADPCNNVYVHDRQAGVTEQILNGPEGGCTYFDLYVAGAGRWISLMEMSSGCLPSEVCSVLWLYDRQEGHAQNLLEGQQQQQQNILSGEADLALEHYSPINSVAFSPDGQTVATGANDGIVRLWQVSNGKPLHTLEGHSRPVGQVAFSPDGTTLVSGSHDQTVAIWRVPDGVMVGQLQAGSEILCLEISPDGKLLALGGTGGAWVWEMGTETFTLVDWQEYPGGYVNDLAFAPDGNLLALALSDETVWLRRVPAGETVLRLGGYGGKILSLAFSPDGRYLAAGSEDNSVGLWQLERTDETIQARRVLTLKHPDWIESLAFSPAGTTIATGTMDRAVRLWSIPDGELLQTLTSHYSVSSVAFSPDGHTLAAGTIGGKLLIWWRVVTPQSGE